MAFDIGELQGTLTMDPTGVQEGLDEAASMLTGFAASGAKSAKAAGKKIGDALTPDTSAAEKALAAIGKTLDQQTGAVTANTRAWAANEIGSDKLKELEKLGVSTREYIDAISGVPGAMERMQTALAGNETQLRQLNQLTSQVAASQDDFATRARAAGTAVGEAGEEVGRFGDGLKGLNGGVDSVVEKLQELGSSGKAAALAAGAAIGAGLTLAIAAAFESDTVTRQIQATLGSTAEDAGRFGAAAGKLFASNYGSSMEEAGQAVTSVVKNMQGLGEVSQDVLTSITGQVISVAQVFEQDFNAVTRTAGQLMKTGLAANAQEAMDIITKGLQSPVNAADDLLDTFDEYSTIFRSLGLDGKDALGLLSQGLQAGARDADTVADSLKEMLLRLQAGDSRRAITELGLNFQAATDQIAKGGAGAKATTDLIIDALNRVTDPAHKSALAVELFGTKAEDMQAALAGLDVSSAASEFEAAYGQIAGAAGKLDSTVGGSLQASFESVYRAMSGFVTEAGSTLAPVLQAAAAAFAFLFDVLKGALTWIGDLPGPILLVGAGVAVWASWGAIAVGVEALKVAVLGLAASTKTLLASLGPIGILLVAVGTAMAFLMDTSDGVEEALAAQDQYFENLAATLDVATGAITDNTAATIKKQAIDSGMAKTLADAGISLETYTQAALGNKDAQEELAAGIAKAKSEATGSGGAFGFLAGAIDEGTVSQQALTDAMASGDWTTVTAQVQAYAESQGRAANDVGVTTSIMDQFTAAMQAGAGPTQALDAILGMAGNTAGELATAQADAAAMTAGTSDAAAAAYDNLLALATVGGLSAEQIQAMGTEAGLTAPQIDAIKAAADGAQGGLTPFAEALTAAGTAASELDSLVQFLQMTLDLMSGKAISAEQATRANEAALRDMAASVRDVAEAARDKQDADAAGAEALQKLNDLVNQGITSGTDYEAAQRALTEAQAASADATDALSDAQDKQFDSGVKARDSALEMAAAAYANEAAQGNMEGAAASATAIIEAQRQRFIAAQPEADRLSGKADQVATSLFGIPGAVATTLSQQGASAVQAAANDTSTAIGAIPPSKNVNLTVSDAVSGAARNALNALSLIPDTKNVTITATVGQSVAAAAGQALATLRFAGGYTGGLVEAIMGFAGGGQVPGTPPSNPQQDNVLATVNGKPLAVRSKEWIQPEESVDYYGAPMMRAIQFRTFPKPGGFAEGGQPGGLADGGELGAAAASNVQVFIGNEEITDRVDVRIDGRFAELRGAVNRKQKQRV